MIGAIAVLALLKILGSAESSQPAAAHSTAAARPAMAATSWSTGM